MLTTASLQNGVTYTIVATATDSVGLTGTRHRTSFAYLTPRTRRRRSPRRPAARTSRASSRSRPPRADDQPGDESPSAEFQYAAERRQHLDVDRTIDTGAPYTTPWNTTAVADGAVRPAGDRHRQRGEHDDVGDPHGDRRQQRADRQHHRARRTARSCTGSTVAGELELGRLRRSGVGERDVPVQADRPACTWTTIGAPDTSSPYGVTLEHDGGSPTAPTTCASSRPTTSATAVHVARRSP